MRCFCLLLVVTTACGGAEPKEGTQVRMDFTRAADFYAAPFPSDDLVDAAGKVDLLGFPNPNHVDIVHDMLSLLKRDARGFALSGGVFFSLSDALDSGRLPSAEASREASSPVFLVGVDKDAPDYLVRYPVQVRFDTDGGPLGAANLLSLLPVQGVPLRPHTTYAAVVLRKLGDAKGRKLGVSLPMAQLVAGEPVAGLSGTAYRTYRRALAALSGLAIEPQQVAGMAVFTTGDPVAELVKVYEHALLAGAPLPSDFVAREVFDSFCVFEGTVTVPVYQQGTPPYATTGGDWAFAEDGTPVVQGEEQSRVFVTIPRQPMPAAGYPLVMFVRTGGGGDRPLIDRGVRADGVVLEPGSGPARELALVGFAGLTMDGPHGGVRNVSGGDEQFLMFNVGNPSALRDNVRQSALELMLVAEGLDSLTLDVSSCPDTSAPGGARFDTSTLTLMGHSMGSTIAPLALAVQPRFVAGILSGAGGSYLENVMYKQKPVAVRPTAELFLGYDVAGRSLVEHDPVLTILQWAAEPADPQVYARYITREPRWGAPRHILMLQGIVDHYIMPPIANALSVALGLDLAGEARDAETAELASFQPVTELLPLVGAKQVSLPASANGPASATDILVQHPEDGVEDGHEVMFQTELPKAQYRCFLATLHTGAPEVPASLDGCL